jgi:hypothetical protein
LCGAKIPDNGDYCPGCRRPAVIPEDSELFHDPETGKVMKNPSRASFITSETLSHIYYLWRDKKIVVPPAKAELVLPFAEIRKALLSFRFDARPRSGARIDAIRAISINEIVTPGLDLTTSKESLESVERKDIDITGLLRSSQSGETNIVEVNYTMSPLAQTKTKVFGRAVARLTLAIEIFFSSRSISLDAGGPPRSYYSPSGIISAANSTNDSAGKAKPSDGIGS